MVKVYVISLNNGSHSFHSISTFCLHVLSCVIFPVIQEIFAIIYFCENIKEIIYGQLSSMKIMYGS